MPVQSLTPTELKTRLDAGDDLDVLDVRENEELEICKLEGALHIPMSELSVRHTELDPERTIVCMCHHGMRSANVAAALEGMGFDKLYNLTGGIDRWAGEVEPDMARY